MASMISEQSLIRGADGRLYSISADGVATIAEAGTSQTAGIRTADTRGFNPADHEAARNAITPGL